MHLRRNACADVSVIARGVVTGIILLGTILASYNRATAGGVPATFNVQAETACEAEMLGKMEAREVFSGKVYDVLTTVARAYGRPVPHIYILSGEWNMAYIAASAAVDGRGKIVVGEQAIERFNRIALEGFLGHEMAHLVSDNAAEGCNDYVVRDPQMEADADALAARTLGRRPVKAFLERVLALTDRQNQDAKRRLEMLGRLQFTKTSGISTTKQGALRSDVTSGQP
jgi:Zn-dependent protease with chaperone function